MMTYDEEWAPIAFTDFANDIAPRHTTRATLEALARDTKDWIDVRDFCDEHDIGYREWW